VYNHMRLDLLEQSMGCCTLVWGETFCFMDGWMPLELPAGCRSPAPTALAARWVMERDSQRSGLEGGGRFGQTHGKGCARRWMCSLPGSGALYMQKTAADGTPRKTISIASSRRVL